MAAFWMDNPTVENILAALGGNKPRRVRATPEGMHWAECPKCEGRGEVCVSRSPFGYSGAGDADRYAECDCENGSVLVEVEEVE